MSVYDPTQLPEGLPVPEDDGAADHLLGAELHGVVLPSTAGHLDLAREGEKLLVLYVYPRTGRSGVEPPTGWDATPGARGCTPQSCGYRDQAEAFQALGARVIGLSAQTMTEQQEAVDRLHLPQPVIADPELRVGEALGLPTFDVDGVRLYKRLTFVAEHRRIIKVFYPVFPPDENAAEVLTWLHARA